MEKEKNQAVDLDKLAILFQRRYNIFRDIKSATDELSLALSRNDAVSAELILQIRNDHLEKCDQNWQEIALMAEEGQEAADYMRRFAFAAPEDVTAENKSEERILEIRKRIDSVLKSIQQADRILNIRTAKEKSFYQS